MTIYQHVIGKDLILIAYSGNKYKNEEKASVKIPIGKDIGWADIKAILDFARTLIKWVIA